MRASSRHRYMMREQPERTYQGRPETPHLEDPAVRHEFVLLAAREPDAEELIITALGELTNREIGDVLGLSPSRVDQIFQKAKRKICRANPRLRAWVENLR